MIGMHRVELNGVQLDEIDEEGRILVIGISEETGKYSEVTNSTWMRPGTKLERQRRDYVDVVVTFAIMVTRASMDIRDQLFDKVMSWVGEGGTLKVNYKPGKEIVVYPQSIQGAGDEYAWETNYKITFRTKDIPNWQKSDVNQNYVSSFRSGTIQHVSDGTDTTVMDLMFRNISGYVCNSMTIRNNTSGEFITFSGMNIGNNDTLMITHSNGVLRATVGGVRSLIPNRSVDSSDDIHIKPGSNSITISSDRNGQLTITSKGRYL